jgi:hypothetical protein
MAKIASFKFSENGGTIGLPLTKCLFVTETGVFLPGSAFEGSGKTVFFEEKIIA